ASTAQAQFWGSSGGGFNGGDFDGDGGGSSSNSFGQNGGFGNGSNFLGFDFNTAQRIRLIHGVLASLAFVILFPTGGIIIRVVPSRAAIWIHALCQILAYIVYTVSFGMGIWLVKTLDNPSVNYHPIIGIVVFAALFFQPFLGLMHHLMFKRHQRRQIWSYGHLWIGRLFITLGIINGGLGLYIADNTYSGKIAYGVVAAVFWLLWVLCAVYGEVKRARSSGRMPPPYVKESPGGGSSPSSYATAHGGSTAGVARSAVDAPAHAPPMGANAEYYNKRPTP
ncbi:hypothetical protein K402DRAFT_325745, partial [Aulographum hederae CBS 113979]